jgi:plastocyanin
VNVGRLAGRGPQLQHQDLGKRMRKAAVIGVVCVLVTSSATLAGIVAAQYSVSQKGRAFTPLNVTLKRGEAVLIVNDDADLRHHAYIDSDKFTFDSGDQEPGSKTNIAFPVAGTFEVLCAIHPKMKLIVHVE